MTAAVSMFNLLSFIPSLTAPGKVVKEQMDEFNALGKAIHIRGL